MKVNITVNKNYSGSLNIQKAQATPDSPQQAATSNEPKEVFTRSAQAATGVESAASSAIKDEHVPGELIIRTKGGFGLASQNSVVKSLGGKLLDRLDMGSVYKGFDGEVLHVKLPEGLDVAKAMEQLKDNDAVAYSEPNFVTYLDDHTLDQTPKTESKPNDLHKKLWGLNNEGQTGGTVDADIDAVEAWGKTKGGDAKTLFVIDTGIDYNHPDLKDNMWVNKGEIAGDGIDNDGNGVVDDVYGYNAYADSGDPMDGHSHGTHCAGTIGAVGDNNEGVVGVSQKAKIGAVKIFSDSGRTTSMAILRGINYATKMGADITSNSWGGGVKSEAAKEAFSSSSALHIMAAGNSGSNNDVRPHYPSNYDIDNKIAVAASDHNDKLAYFSCYGEKTVDIAAPGVNVWSTVPISKGSYGNMSGTSMATPHVAGAALLVANAYPGLSNVEIKEALLGTAEEKPAFEGKMTTNGRLNVDKALDRAAEIAAKKEAATAEQEAIIA